MRAAVLLLLAVVLPLVQTASARADGPVTFATEQPIYTISGPPAVVSVQGLASCAGKQVRVGFSRDGGTPLVGVAEADVDSQGALRAIVPMPPLTADYVLVVFDDPSAPCVPGGRAVSAQTISVVHDIPVHQATIPPPPLPAGLTYTMNKLTPYSSPADVAVVWTVSGLRTCTGQISAHLVSDARVVPANLWAASAVDANGSATFSFPVVAITPGRYYAFIGEPCSGLVMTTQPIVVGEPFSSPTPAPPATGSGSGVGANRSLESPTSLGLTAFLALACIASLLALRRR